MAPATSYLALALALLATTTTAAPAPAPAPGNNAHLTPRTEGEAHFQTNWDEGGRKRYRYNFKGTSCGTLELAIIHHGAIPGPAGMNWQCGDWGAGDGWQTFDCSVVAGVAGAAIIADGIRDVTGQSCDQSGFCP